jgi:hypothetical protein
MANKERDEYYREDEDNKTINNALERKERDSIGELQYDIQQQ